jgi:uncharacterized membrane protein YkoI
MEIMRKLALLTTLALAGSSAIALGDPHYDRSGDHDRDRYDRYDNSRSSREYRGRWVSLANGYSANASRQFINLKGRAGSFDKIRLEADRGSPVFKQVAIEFTDGNTQVVRIDSRLPRGAGEVIRLNGNARINRIIVYTEPTRGGSYSVYGA